MTDAKTLHQQLASDGRRHWKQSLLDTDRVICAKVLEALDISGDEFQISSRTGLSPATVRAAIDALVADGQVTSYDVDGQVRYRRAGR